MAPCTRCRADPVTRVPNVELMSRYYSERSEFGMILTEATSVNAMGVGYPGTPGIWSDEQTKAWSSIVDAVHEQVRPQVELGAPRALTLEEIAQTVEDYRIGAENAKKASFDGIEVHEYGDSDMKMVYTHVAQELERRNIAFIFARENWLDENIPEIGPSVIKANLSGVFIANEKFNLETGEKAIQDGKADAIGYGIPAISNADLVKRYMVGAELNKPNFALFMGYDVGNEGLNDYPLLLTAEAH
ncbi:hypothetical protein SARC_01005 [Sphaeroforma arctica JP610]|uniref:NADH:flavin oxidoreductase/NADH oxidase N-terminal domain-containing protein n=1 Tax=Sphaeroforma arctica JP610 TaxID=667725 RepID=A0A0L0GD73_9EUKA|nr:hypothetical protein SARC_01005 [Sphaeroforma arctica JP610]KNC86859.1 hypothetical protein SARC_01005 [Sphaeroforma arctica JP610]|eukprot:XP_014160761.1 hypothetical protein SARC_01005 [Sphaeroforma arctica JP610]